MGERGGESPPFPGDEDSTYFGRAHLDGLKLSSHRKESTLTSRTRRLRLLHPIDLTVPVRLEIRGSDW